MSMRANSGSADPTADGLLKMSELAEASGVSAGTIKHYLREGLLPEPVKTSRNMAYYPPDFVDRIRLIKQLQEERFMPLKAIRKRARRRPRAGAGAGRARGPRSSSALSGGRAARTSRAEAERRYEIPREVLDRLEEIGVLTPNSRGYGDARRAHAGGDQPLPRRRLRRPRSASPSTTRCATRARSSSSSRRRSRSLLERLAGDVEPDRIVELLETGAEPLRDLIAAMHSKLLLAELQRHRDARG